MKKSVLLLLLGLSLFSCYVSASDNKYSICSVAGYYDGNGDRFLHELAVRVVDKNGLSADSVCVSATKAGKEVAIKFATPGKVKGESDAAVIGHAEHFRNLIYDAILSRIKFD